ncbi:MAG: VWA domain-containing protein [Spirochaetes bacterium]|nr:VWA domain-containing protein [Spirochaetota bacterium]
MKIYRLGNPWALFYLILPLICLIILVVSKFIYKKGVKISGVSNFSTGFSFLIPGYYITLILILSGMFITAFSLTKPQYGVKKERIVSKGIDIIIALDTSASMLNEDFLQQSRIEGAKNIILNFIQKRKGDRIGLVTFGENSFVRSPATLNSQILEAIVKIIKINPHNPSAQKTAIGIGLASAVNRLIKIKDSESSISKIVILVTDGINNSGEISPQAAAEIASQTNIKVYTVGVGDKAEVDLDLLKFIAEKTGGTFFHAKTSGELAPIFEQIDKLEKHKIETYEFSRFKNVGYKYASFGLSLLLIGILMNIFIFKRIS